MPYVPEFYPKKQGRPYSPETRDLETRQGSLYANYSSFKSEYMELKDLMDKLINDQIGKIEEVLLELKEIKLHLASQSDETITKEDADAE